MGLNIKNEETCRLAGLTGEPLLFKGVVEKPPQGKNACGVFTVLARNTSLVGLQTNPRSSLGLTFITRVKHSFINRV